MTDRKQIIIEVRRDPRTKTNEVLVADELMPFFKDILAAGVAQKEPDAEISYHYH